MNTEQNPTDNPNQPKADPLETISPETFRQSLPVLFECMKGESFEFDGGGEHDGPVAPDAYTLPVNVELPWGTWARLHEYAKRDGCSIDMAISLLAQEALYQDVECRRKGKTPTTEREGL